MKLILAVILITLRFVVYGQFPEYYTYLVKGNVSVQKNNTKGQQLLPKQWLFKEDVLTVHKDAEVRLINKSANFVVLNSPGTYHVSDLEEKLQIQTTPSLTKSYLILVWQQVLDPNYDFTKFKRTNLGGAYGGVQRGQDCDRVVFPANGFRTSLREIQFRWHKADLSSDTLLVLDAEGQIRLKITLKDSFITVDLVKEMNASPGRYFWQIKNQRFICDEEPATFEIMGVAEEEKMVQDITDKFKDNGLFYRLAAIESLEANGFIYPAIKSYDSLLEKYPDDIALRKSYILFLLNYGFNKNAADMWKTTFKN